MPSSRSLDAGAALKLVLGHDTSPFVYQTTRAVTLKTLVHQTANPYTLRSVGGQTSRDAPKIINNLSEPTRCRIRFTRIESPTQQASSESAWTLVSSACACSV
jgi:hypothetical protein